MHLPTQCAAQNVYVMFLGQCIPSITLHQVFVYRLAFCISVLLEASQNMPGSRPNIARRAAWTLDFVYDSTPKSSFDRGFRGRCHSLQFSQGEYQPTWHPRLPQVPCICLRALSSVLQENEIWVFLLFTPFLALPSTILVRVSYIIRS